MGLEATERLREPQILHKIATIRCANHNPDLWLCKQCKPDVSHTHIFTVTMVAELSHQL